MRNYTIQPKRETKNHSIHKSVYWYSFWKSKPSFKKISKVLWLIFLFWVVVWFWLFQIRIKGRLPDIGQIKDITFSQATVITDRNDKVLYKLFDENREYVEYSGINKNMINAIIAVEDQRYRDHNGLDTMGIFRAILAKILNPSSRLQWASTIPQQFVRNLLLTNDRKLERKLKEMVLAKRLDSVIEEEIKDSVWKLSSTEMTHVKKERVLELYLNYIFLWNNAYWVEAAAQTYFGWSASGLDILQSSILASIPKWPSLYNPYKNRSQIMWEIKIRDGNKNEYPFSSGGLQDEIISKITSILSKADFSNKADYNSFSKYIKWLLEFTVYYEWSKYNVEYSLWRKDFVLSRMFEDEYITQDDLVDAFIEWLDIEFQSSWFPIRAPHFVMRVTELLEQQYDKKTLMNDWLVVKTTLDLDIQDIAEKSLLDNTDALAVYWATNESMVYLDTENGDVLAYIGSIDYFNDDIGGQNDMIRSSRQVGSAMKPLIYSLWFSLLPLTLDTPIYDIPFQIWPDRPNNADWKFLGILPLKKALAYSRNVPAAKVITALWWQDVALPFLRKLWLSWLDQNWNYWYPLAFGAWEVPLIELANAYSHLSNTTPWEINPILEIRTSNDSLLYEKEVKKQEGVIAPGISYLLRSILSDPANMPPERAPKYSVRGLKFWLKSGTSNMKTPKWDRARDWLLVTYTPSRVALFWGWNADGSPMYQNAYGGFLNADAMREFRSTLLANNYVSNQWMSAVDVAEVAISKISGKLASDSTPSEFVVKSLAYINTQPTQADPGMSSLEFDSSCVGLSSPYTPTEELKKWYIVSPTSFMPNSMDINEITTWWQWSINPSLMWEFDKNLSGKVTFNYDNILLSMPQDYCENRSPQVSEDIVLDIKNLKAGQKISTRPMIWFNVKSPNNIKRISVSINGRVIWSTEYRWNSNDITDVIASDLWEELGQWELTILAIDTEWYSNRKSIDLSIVASDTTAPFILKENTYTVKEWDKYRIFIFLNDEFSSVDGGTIKQWDTILKTFQKNIAEFVVSTPWVVQIKSKDSFGNELNDTLDLTQYIQWYKADTTTNTEVEIGLPVADVVE